PSGGFRVSAAMPVSLELLGRLDAVEAVRRILHGEEYNIAIRRRLARVHGVGRNIDDRARLNGDFLSANIGVKGSFEHVDPLLVRVRMGFGAGACPHPHQPDDHAVTFDAWTMGS